MCIDESCSRQASPHTVVIMLDIPFHDICSWPGFQTLFRCNLPCWYKLQILAAWCPHRDLNLDLDSARSPGTPRNITSVYLGELKYFVINVSSYHMTHNPFGRRESASVLDMGLKVRRIPPLSRCNVDDTTDEW